jgi:hypothetical protein
MVDGATPSTPAGLDNPGNYPYTAGGTLTQVGQAKSMEILSYGTPSGLTILILYIKPINVSGRKLSNLGWTKNVHCSLSISFIIASRVPRDRLHDRARTRPASPPPAPSAPPGRARPEPSYGIVTGRAQWLYRRAFWCAHYVRII